MPKIRPLEILLVQVIIYLFLWIFDDYLASMLSLIIGGIMLFILLMSLVVELVERSKVPRWYFYFLGVSVLAPLIAGLVYLLISGGLGWMDK